MWQNNCWIVCESTSGYIINIFSLITAAKQQHLILAKIVEKCMQKRVKQKTKFFYGPKSPNFWISIINQANKTALVFITGVTISAILFPNTLLYRFVPTQFQAT